MKKNIKRKIMIICKLCKWKETGFDKKLLDQMSYVNYNKIKLQN